MPILAGDVQQLDVFFNKENHTFRYRLGQPDRVVPQCSSKELKP
jgi:hypothetical protein